VLAVSIFGRNDFGTKNYEYPEPLDLIIIIAASIKKNFLNGAAVLDL